VHTAISSLRHLDPPRTTLLVGAGISVDPPSSIPPAAVLTDVLCQWIARKDARLRRTLSALRTAPSARDPFLGPYATLRFELLLDWLLYYRPEVMDALSTVQDGGSPNRWHYWIASFLEAGGRVVTTNFDTRIEEAAARCGCSLRVAIISTGTPRLRELERAQLVKVHGTFAARRRSSASHAPVGTLRQIARWGLGYSRRPSLRDVLLRTLSRDSLIVCGYSAWDSFDVVPLLERVAGRTRMTWFEWAPKGRLRTGRSLPKAHAVELWDASASPAEMFLTQRAALGHVTRVTGTGAAFLSTVWRPADEHRFMRRIPRVAVRPRVGEPSAAKRLAMTLSTRVDRLTAQEARLVVGALASAYGNERAADQRLPKTPAPSMKGERRLRKDLDRGRIGVAADRFMQVVDESEDPEDPQPFAETVVWILEKMFWHALNLNQQETAAVVLKRLDHEARRRRVLWAQVLTMYLMGNLLHHRAHRATTKREGRRLRRECATVLWDALGFALKLPRIDIAADAARLLLYVELDPTKCALLEAALMKWLRSVRAGETHLLVLFDLLRRHVKRGEPVPPVQLITRIQHLRRATARVPNAAGYIAIAEAYTSVYGTEFEFGKSLRRLDAVIRKTDLRYRGELVVERNQLAVAAQVYRHLIAERRRRRQR
jgi:hypothetical protein